MTLKMMISSLLSFVLGAVVFAGATATSSTSTNGPTTSVASRTADREAIRAHIENIFQDYLDRDCDGIRAAHSHNWIGFSAFSRTILRGREEYMRGSARSCLEKTPSNPDALVMVDYKLSDIDFVFYGDVALVPYVADTVYGKTARLPGKLRSLDVYAKLNGAWIQVGSHLDLHPDTVALQRSTLRPLSANERNALMSAREATWRAIFSNDREMLEKLIPKETIAINPGREHWADQAAVFAGAEEFAKGGGKLVRLEFPKTEIQLYGDVAILYTTYVLELDMQGKSSTRSGRATEIFVRRNGVWVNPGWHMDSGI